MSKKIYVGNLSYDVTNTDLESRFSDFGKVVSVKLITDMETGRSKGFAFVEMDTEEDALKCIDNLDGQDFCGRGLKVNIAKDRAPARSNRRQW